MAQPVWVDLIRVKGDSEYQILTFTMHIYIIPTHIFTFRNSEIKFEI